MEHSAAAGGLRAYSTGIVAESATTEHRGFIKVFPIEQMAEHDGELLDIEELETMIKTNSGSVKQLVATKEVTVTAQWINAGGTDRVTPPLVRHGETVRLYRLSGSDQFYWATMQNEMDLRRRDSVTHSVGNTEEFGVILDETNTYFTITDTINKKVKLIKTNDNDGEATWYDFTIKTDEGWWEFTDGKGNFLKLDSVKNVLTVEVDEMIFNASKSYTINSPLITFNTDEFFVNAKKSITFTTDKFLTKAKTSISFYTEKFWSEVSKRYSKVKEQLTNADKIFTKTNFYKLESKTTEIDGGDITVKGKSLVVFPSTQFRDEVSFDKVIYVNGYASFKGATFSGTANFSDGSSF